MIYLDIPDSAWEPLDRDHRFAFHADITINGVENYRVLALAVKKVDGIQVSAGGYQDLDLIRSIAGVEFEDLPTIEVEDKTCVLLIFPQEQV
jgi:hypothetical protein